eukprot:scaffold47261_cov53-Cyclotella_meneghiniana.AAC.1
MGITRAHNRARVGAPLILEEHPSPFVRYFTPRTQAFVRVSSKGIEYLSPEVSSIGCSGITHTRAVLLGYRVLEVARIQKLWSLYKGRASPKTVAACWAGRKNYAAHQVTPPPPQIDNVQWQ